MAKVYIETSIVSYLRQSPSSQVVMAARQLLTHQWWDDERGNYELETSQYTWNCKHIANAKILPRIYDVLTSLGCPIPIICTPEEMVDDDSEDNES
jgi:hypothetical protein